MQQKQLALMLSATILALAGHYAQAQQTPSAATPSATTRAQVKMERDEFIKSHQWDPVHETWILKPEFEPPAAMKGRAQVRKERDEFLKNNRWDAAANSWIPLVKPREISQLSREQVRKETQQFLRTHEWDTAAEAWVLRQTSSKKVKP
jgi:hypothetical protein